MKNNYEYGSLDSFLSVTDVTLPLDWRAVFGNEGPLEVEIGFGTGEYITALAAKDAGCNLVGFEENAKRTIKTLRKIHEQGLKNVRLMKLDAVLGLQHLFSPGSLRQVHCLFPCPWPKKRHTKHRLFQPAVLRLIHSRLRPEGQVLIVTDHKPYADWIADELPSDLFELSRRTINARFDTKFERKWRQAGQAEFYELVLKGRGLGEDPVGGSAKVKTYFLKEAHPDKIRLTDQSGPVSVQFADFVFDRERKKAMVHAVATEDRHSQHIWIVIVHTSKGWCIAPADGTSALPTAGVQRAVEMVFEAAAATAKD